MSDSSQVKDKNCLSYWCPKLAAAMVPIPRTRIVTTANDCRGDEILNLLDGECPPHVDSFLRRLTFSVADEFKDSQSRRAFLRTGQTSGKHQWRKTCFIDFPADSEHDLLWHVSCHVSALAEYSAMADMLGLPLDVWVVREMLDTEPVTVLDRYGNFPLVAEIRAFIGGGKVKCIHPYWPEDSIREGLHVSIGKDFRPIKLPQSMAIERGRWIKEAQSIFIGDILPATRLIEQVADLFNDDGEWSVDMLRTRKGDWYVTDMAVADRSFHYPGCPFEPAEQRSQRLHREERLKLREMREKDDEHEQGDLGDGLTKVDDSDSGRGSADAGAGE